MIIFRSYKHSIGEQDKPTNGSGMTEKAFFMCGWQIGLRFSDTNLYFNCNSSTDYVGVTPTKEASSFEHYRLKPKTVLSFFQE